MKPIDIDNTSNYDLDLYISLNNDGSLWDSLAELMKNYSDRFDYADLAEKISVQFRDKLHDELCHRGMLKDKAKTTSLF